MCTATSAHGDFAWSKSFRHDPIDSILIFNNIGVGVSELGGIAEKIMLLGMREHGNFDVALLLGGVGDYAFCKAARGEKAGVCANAADKALRLTAHKSNGAIQHFAACAVVFDAHMGEDDIQVRIVGDHGQIGDILEVGCQKVGGGGGIDKDGFAPLPIP